MSFFQIVVTGLFVALVVVGVGVFALFGGVGGAGSAGPVVVWGTVEQGTMDAVLANLAQKDKTLADVRYIAKKPATYEAELVNAIAAGQGPDLVFLSQATIGTLSDKTVLIPYGAVSQGEFVDSYIDEGQLFLTPQGILALPFTIDPMVMYWNRDLFAGAGQGQPPQLWDELLVLAPKLTSLDAGGGVRKSAAALGTWDNITNAKALVSTLLMQVGDYVTNRDASGALVPTLGSKPGGVSVSPASQALDFYTSFANPSKTNYSWNRSLSMSYNSFVAGDLAVYFGFASEYRSIQERNPNLRFGIALMPQLKGATTKVTSGTIQGLAIARGSYNPQGALTVARKLTGAQASAVAAQQTGLPPARRDVQVNTSASAAAATFVQSALMARSWADPNTARTDEVFKTMVESILSGRSGTEQAVFDAAQALRQLLPTR